MFNLIDALEKYVTYDAIEESDKQKTLNFLRNNKNCFSRTNKDGHITSGAFVCDNEGNILLNHHKQTGMWLLLTPA